jgi:hypothetical protein
VTSVIGSGAPAGPSLANAEVVLQFSTVTRVPIGV